MHVTDWAEAQHEDPEIKAAWTGVASIRRNQSHGQRLGLKKNTPEGRSIMWNANKLTLSGELLYYR